MHIRTRQLIENIAELAELEPQGNRLEPDERPPVLSAKIHANLHLLIEFIQKIHYISQTVL
jgi:hypothetical protein